MGEEILNKVVKAELKYIDDGWVYIYVTCPSCSEVSLVGFHQSKDEDEEFNCHKCKDKFTIPYNELLKEGLQ